MRLNNQVLRSRSVGPLNTVEYLDLSNLGIVSIGERLSSCLKLTTLILSGNKLQDASGLDVCQQLWHLDLSNNQVQSVEGLSRFLALGTLVLSNNQLSWPDLAHLRHINILSLSLHGNQQLERDPYYRIHVIDCLPNVWMLDGRIITSAERIQVSQFFQDSALTERPVRRKLKKDGFVPSALKQIEIDGIFGNKAIQMMRSFPKNGVLNIEMDWKRLHYLALNLQEDINLQWQYTARVPGKHRQNLQKQNILADLFDARPDDRERCNMVLLMLVASLDFVLPTHLVKDTLETGKLSSLGNVQVMDLFFLPRALRCKLVALLVSAVKVDREQNEDGGLYTKLYLCLYHMVSELTKLSESAPGTELLHPDSRLAAQLRDFKCLLATEVVQLMCIVPSFFDYLDRDIGVMNLVRIATADPDINEKLIQISATKVDEEGDKDKTQNDVFKMMADFLLMKVQEQLQNLTNKPAVLASCDRILSKSSALPMKGNKSPVCKAEYLVRGVGSPDDDPPAINPRKMSAKTRTKFPHLGDRLLLGPQTIGKIISLPQPTMALVIIDAVPVASGAVEHKLKEAEQHYTYVNMDQLEWDAQVSMWKPKGTVGDKYTLQSSSDFNKEANMSLALETYRPSSPDTVYAQDPQAARSSTPLFFTNTPRKLVFVPTETSSAAASQPKTRRPQRPLSSVYKERLKLSLDLSRRAKSAGTRRPFAVKYGPKSATTKSQKSPILGDHLSGMKVDLKGVSLEIEGGCSNPPSVSRLTPGYINSDRNTQRSNRSAHPVATSTPKREDRTGKENKPPVNTNSSSCEQQEQLSTGEKGDDHEEDNRCRTPAPSEQTIKSSVEKSLGELSEKAAQDHREIFMTALSESPRTFEKSYSKYQLAGRSRPVSAVERQVKIKKPTDNIYHTEFQQQRIDAWKHATRSSSQPKLLTASEPPPPQRPSSPIPFQSGLPPPTPKPQDNISITTSNDTICTANIPSPLANKAFLQRRIPKSNLWLAGGRDLFWEKLKGRPKSGHTPGWKEGLPESMKPRPRSAAARFNRTKTSAPQTPASTRKDPAHHGLMMLNELADLPETKQPGIPVHMTASMMAAMNSSASMGRRYSSQRSLYDEDPLPGPMPDTVYSPLKVRSYQRPYGSPNGCLPCVYEHYLDDLQDYESCYTPACNTPTQELQE